MCACVNISVCKLCDGGMIILNICFSFHVPIVNIKRECDYSKAVACAFFCRIKCLNNKSQKHVGEGRHKELGRWECAFFYDTATLPFPLLLPSFSFLFLSHTNWGICLLGCILHLISLAFKELVLLDSTFCFIMWGLLCLPRIYSQSNF